MYLFWAMSVSPGLSACSYSHCRIVEITNPAESPAIHRQSSHYKPREKNKDHKRRGDRSSGGGRGAEIVFPSAGVLINIVIVQLQKGGGVSRSAVIDFERVLFHLFFWMN